MGVQYGVGFSAGGRSVQQSIVRETDGTISVQGTLAVGSLWSSWVKTSASVIAANLTAGHGFSSGVFDFTWAESGVRKWRYKVDVVVSTNAITTSNGAGDNFPASGQSDVVMSPRTRINVTIDGDDSKLILCVCGESTTNPSTAPLHVTYYDVSDAVVTAQNLIANVPFVLDIVGGSTTTLTGNVITYVYASSGSTSEAMTLKILGGYDATP